MATVKEILRLLEEQRLDLVEQLDAVDRAIHALGGAGLTVAEAPLVPPDAPAEDTPQPVLPSQVKARRVLTDSHKQALVAGRRKARETRDVAKGLAREMPADGFVPAIGTRADRQPPRLVKGPIKK